METVYYRVGRHNYRVNFCDDRNTRALLPSSDPFLLNETPAADEPLLFELNVDDNWRPVEETIMEFISWKMDPVR